MVKLMMIAALGGLAAAPVLAETTTTTEKRMRQMTEVVFKNYPPRALAAGEQGAVFFKVAIDDTGHPSSCEVTHGSGHPMLDNETCAMIVRHGVFKPATAGGARQTTHEGVVNWRIPGAAPVPVAAIALTGDAKPAKQICKRTLRTGTIGGYDRTCMTAREWEASRKETQEFWGDMQGRKGSTSGN